MSGALRQRCKYQPYLSKVCSAKDTIPHFKNGQYIGWSGFTPVGDPKVVPIALAEYVEQNNLQGKMRFNLFIGASSGTYNEDRWAKNDMIAVRYPYQNSGNLRTRVNSGTAKFADKHLSMFPQDLAWGFYSKERNGGIDIAIIEASEILEDGSIVLTGAVGTAVEMCHIADKIIIELNTAVPSFKGCHDIVEPWIPPGKPLNITAPQDRIGSLSMKIDPSKVVAVVESTAIFPGRAIKGADNDSRAIAGHIVDFFQNEVKHGRLPENLYPLQSGVGNIANAVVDGLSDSPFGNLTVYTEVLQEAMLPMFDSGKLKFSSSTSMTLSKWDKFYNNFDFYKNKIVLRPQAVSNSPEVIRRLGVIAMNTPVEADMYGHANSTLAGGTRLVNGLGGSGDFERNGYLSIMHCPSARKTKTDPTGISCIIPMCSHIDHTEHDLDVLVTEQGLADLRGLCPVDRARLVIEKCAHPSYKDQLTDYLNMAIKDCQPKARGHEPHILEKVFKMHANLLKNQTMHLNSW
ncbi:Acetyl-CoA hydrolase [Tritrichomonas foetus]|uniref:Acetyl-CoA hydrolase n=1 Tax=Tritrichomonas foetus TaxID=1144522 RepID=A0A1J4J0R7_9EUKA|nr:acetyl-CoA hydrolase [Tritrichomonas foetus]OHS93222.1 Acetyl-CoA hydrolase [Tritrichomonas foetus]|eukprot:OHS93222.1 Acetyl-CoA hydrolase [Tritrichomonas foetus]